MKHWRIPRMWEGATCCIIGGGPGLSQINFSLLSQCRVIAVNDAYKLAQWELCYFKDSNWYFQLAFKDHPEAGTNGDNLKRFGGLKVTSCDSELEDPDVKVLRRGRRDHLERDPDFITHCNNAGAEALALAIMLGCRTILLVGFDMKPVAGKHNWHNNHARQMPDSIYKDYYMIPFRSLAKDARSLGVDIFNCTNGSALDTFPIVPIERVLNAEDRMRA